MAMISLTSSHPDLGPASFRQRSAALRAVLAERAAQRRLYRTTLNALEALGDRDLTDVGIHRSQVREVARQAAGTA